MIFQRQLQALGDALFSLRSSGNPEDPNQPLNAQVLMDASDSLYSNPSGVRVNRRTAMQLSAYYRCVALLSESIASIPFHTYKKTEVNGRIGRERADRPAEKLISTAPNPDITSFYWRETAQNHVLQAGKSCNLIIRNGRGDPLELIPLMPDAAHPEKLKSGRVIWHVYDDQGKYTVEDDDMLVIGGLGFNGLEGYTPLSYMATSLGIALAAEHYGGSFFKNGAHMRGVLTHPKGLSDKARANIKRGWETNYNPENTHKTSILEEGLDYKPIGMQNDQAQFLQTREFQVTEVARWFGIPPNMIGDNQFSTFNNSENQSINLVRYTLRPWFVRWESNVDKKLISRHDQDEYFSSFTADALLRGTTRERYASYAVGRQWGWLSGNDVRSWEHLPPVPGLDTYMFPLNMTDATNPQSAPDPTKTLNEELDSEDESKSISAGRQLIDDAMRQGDTLPDNLRNLILAVADRQAGHELRLLEARLKKDSSDESMSQFWHDLPEYLVRNCGLHADEAQQSVQDVVSHLEENPDSINDYQQWRALMLCQQLGLNNVET